MAIDSTNQAWVVISNVEKLLETEFGDGVIVYISEKREVQNKRSIRLTNLPKEFISRIASMVTNRHNILISVEYPIGSNQRLSTEKALQIVERIERLLTNNCALTIDSTYIWHDGSSEIDYEPDEEFGEEEIEVETRPEIVELQNIVWSVTVSEALPA